MYYYRDASNHEVDFVVKGDRIIKELLQVTYASDEGGIKKNEVESLLKAGKELRCKKLTVITWGYEHSQTSKGQKVEFVPLWKWLLS